MIEDIEAIRIHIRLSIKNHFEKQIELLENNLEIKGLTLFFIDKVINVRDDSREDGRGDFLRIFDEEYQLYIDANKAQIEKYKDYFKNYEDVLNVREGYFAKDKNRKDVEVQYSKSGEVVAKSEEEINNAISLILERKDELISFQEPLSFIFSHSALREGWDNPNVFTICTLKQGSNEIAKKQEIGRGLRLPVDIHGNRCLDSNVNELTVIANDSYDNFSKMLQADFNEDININEVTYDVLSITLSRAGISKAKITTELVNEFRSELLKNDIINEKNILKHKAEKTTKLIKNMTFNNVTLEEHKTKITEKLIMVMNAKGSSKIEIKNGDNEDYDNDYTSLVTQEHFMRVYSKLCDYLRKRTIYKCNIDKDDFVFGCAAHINEYLINFSVDNSYTVSVGTSSFDNTGTFNIDKISEIEVEYCVNSFADAKSDFEIVNYIMYHTMLPRMTIFNILKKIENRNALNFSTILDVVTIKIKDYLENMKANNVISYEVIEGFELDTTNIFSVDKITDLDFSDEKKREKLFEWKNNKSSSLNKYYKLDSEGEKEFAQKLEANDKILMFAKIKKGGFIIDTPYGNYSPDWAIICKEDVANDIGIYFIAETKAQKEERDLTEVEINKIKCGELHFKAVSDIIKFDWVNSYKDFKCKFNI